MSRFKIPGNAYASEWGGNNANAGTDPTLPKLTIAGLSALGGVNVIGSGVYRENNFGGLAKTMQGDGRVIIDGLNGSLGLAGGSVWKNIWFKNVSSLGHSNAQNANVDNIYENVQGHLSPNNTFAANRSIFLPSANPLNTVGLGATVYNCIVLNPIVITNTIYSLGWSGAFFSKNVILPTGNTETFAAANNFDNACINGQISRNGILYESKRNWDGSVRTDADAGVLDIITVFPAFYTRGNFSCLDPEFLDIYSKTVKPTSPLLKRAFLGFFIGAVKPATIFRLDNTDFQFVYTNMNTANPLAVSTLAGQAFGQIRMTGKVSITPITFGVLSLRTILAFWKGAAAGTAENNNVPDAVRLLGLPAGSIDKPRRLTYFMRTSLNPNANQASLDSAWDNDGAGAGTYLLHEDSTVPQHAPFGGTVYGNGDPRAIGSPLSNFNLCAVDIIVVLDQQRV
jgi:hypothetical protein